MGIIFGLPQLLEQTNGFEGVVGDGQIAVKF